MNEALCGRVLQNVDPLSELGSCWEAMVRANSASGVMQSLHWRDTKISQGLIPFHIGVFRQDELVAGSMFYASRRRNGVGMLVAPEGPVLPWDDEPTARQALGLIIDCAEQHASEMGVMAIRIEPRISPPPPRMLREFVRGPVDLVPHETLYIDLTQSNESLLAGMKPKGRYNIKLSQRHGVLVSEERTIAGVRRFYNLMQEASVRDDFSIEPYEFFENLAKVMCDRGCLRFLFAEHEEDTLATMMLVTYGSRATYLYGGISNKKRNLMAGYALQWHAFQVAKDCGATIYDFYGFDAFRSSEHPYARFSQFKSQFGGKFMRFLGSQDLFFTDKLADAFVQLINEANLQAHGARV